MKKNTLKSKNTWLMSDGERIFLFNIDRFSNNRQPESNFAQCFELGYHDILMLRWYESG